MPPVRTFFLENQGWKAAVATELQKPGVSEINRCEVCGSSTLIPVLDLGPHPMCDDLVPIADSRTCHEFPIEILYCDRCITAHQRFQISRHALFPHDYHYRASQTLDVLRGMSELVESCVAALGDLRGKKVLDIGCNDGSLLSAFAAKGARTFGVEPTGAARDAEKRGHPVLPEFFDADVAERVVERFGQPDLVSFTNVFAHIEDLPGLLRGLEVLRHTGTAIVIENHYLGAVLDRFQFDTFYHEHPRTYSYTSLARIADSLSMRICHVEFPERYNGNVRVIYVPRRDGAAHARLAEIHELEKPLGERLRAMARRLDPWRTAKRAAIEAEVAASGRLRAKAFPGRAAIPVRLLGLDENHVVATHEKPGSPKIGHYVPGTRIPILSDEEFPTTDLTRPLLNLAWHIGTEIRTYLRSRGHSGRIIDIVSPDDLRGS